MLACRCYCCCFVLQCSLVTCCQSCVVRVEYPFAKDDEAKRAAQQDASAPAFLASPRAENVPNLVNEQLLQAHMMKMSAMSTMSSFHGDNPFSGWVVLVFALHREENSGLLLTSTLCALQFRLAHAVSARRRVPGHGRLPPRRLEVPCLSYSSRSNFPQALT